MKKVYIAGPYGASSTYDQVTVNISHARAAAAMLRSRGIGFYCQHSHTDHFEVYGGDDEFFSELHDSFIPQCDAMLMLRGWQKSKGSKHERDIAEELGIPVYYQDDGEGIIPTVLFVDYEEEKW